MIFICFHKYHVWFKEALIKYTHTYLHIFVYMCVHAFILETLRLTLTKKKGSLRDRTLKTDDLEH